MKEIFNFKMYLFTYLKGKERKKNGKASGNKTPLSAGPLPKCLEQPGLGQAKTRTQGFHIVAETLLGEPSLATSPCPCYQESGNESRMGT